MGNEALDVNRVVFQHADLEITTHGSDWYFAAMSIMGASTIAVLVSSFFRPASHRLFHYISAAILITATIAYFSMGSNLGQVPIQADFVRPSSSVVRRAGTREIFYVRYIDWFITTPLLLLDLMLTAGMPWQSIAATIFADEVMIICGLVGALVETDYKWGYWTFGMAALFYIAYQLLWEGRKHAAALGGSIKTTYYSCGVVLIVIWFLYPIAWGVSEGGNVIAPDSEAAFYGVLDVIAKPVFTFILLWGHRTIDPAELGLLIREPRAVRAATGTNEKHGHHHNGVGAGVGAGAAGAAGGAAIAGHDGVNGHHQHGATGEHNVVDGHHSGIGGQDVTGDRNVVDGHANAHHDRQVAADAAATTA